MYIRYRSEKYGWNKDTLPKIVAEAKNKRTLLLDETGRPLVAIVPVKDLETLEGKGVPELSCVCGCPCTWPVEGGVLSFYRCVAGCDCEYCKKTNCGRNT